MGSESTQKKLSRVRKPRVHIEYEVFTNGAMEKKELPFIAGVMGDFSGDPTEKLESIREREFVNIDRDNFDGVMNKMNAGLNIRVNNTIANDDTEVAVQLKFGKMDDFSPAAVAEQVPQLKKLLETRDKLRDLIVKIDGSNDLENILEDAIKSTDDLAKLAGELGIEDSNEGGE
jgi:type VI secretion system protein ImpB